MIYWVLLLQEFEFEVKDRKGTENQVVDHLSRLEDEVMRELGEKAEIDDTFPDEHVLTSSQDLIPFADLGIIWLVISSHQTCPFIKGKSSCMM